MEQCGSWPIAVTCRSAGELQQYLEQFTGYQLHVRQMTQGLMEAELTIGSHPDIPLIIGISTTQALHLTGVRNPDVVCFGTNLSSPDKHGQRAAVGWRHLAIEWPGVAGYSMNLRCTSCFVGAGATIGLTFYNKDAVLAEVGNDPIVLKRLNGTNVCFPPESLHLAYAELVNERCFHPQQSPAGKERPIGLAVQMLKRSSQQRLAEPLPDSAATLIRAITKYSKEIREGQVEAQIRPKDLYERVCLGSSQTTKLVKQIWECTPSQLLNSCHGESLLLLLRDPERRLHLGLGHSPTAIAEYHNLRLETANSAVRAITGQTMGLLLQTA